MPDFSPINKLILPYEEENYDVNEFNYNFLTLENALALFNKALLELEDRVIKLESASGTPQVSLVDSTWSEIAQAVSDGTASTKWNIGDSKDITLTTGETLTVQIYGFNHDDLADGSGKAGITFGLKDLMPSKQVVDSSTAQVGWEGSSLRTWLNNDFLSTLPNDLQAVLKTMHKKSIPPKSTTVKNSTDKLFLFSEIEVYGTVTLSNQGEGNQYPYFENAMNRSKLNTSGAVSSWWTRSVYNHPSYPNNILYILVGNSTPIDLNGSFAWAYNFGFCV